MLVLNGGKLQFLQTQSFVESSPGVRYSLTIPYTEAQLRDIRFAQSGNTLYLAHPAHPPKLLQRISDANWTLTDIPFNYLAVSDVTFSNAFITFKIINSEDKFQVGDRFIITTTAGAISTISGPTNGLTEKTSVTSATTENITLSGLQTIDGRLTVDDDRVLVKNQTSAAANGIYRAGANSVR